MKKRVFSFSLLIGLLFLLGSNRETDAQTGLRLPPLPCVTYNQAPSIFVGQVLSLRADDSKEDDRLLVEILVRESFKGAVEGSKVVISETAPRADYMGLAAGKLFLVYAYNPDSANLVPTV